MIEPYSIHGARWGELLNTLAQPTRYEWGRQRQDALMVVCTCFARVAADRLEGRDVEKDARMIATLRKKYKITDEDIHGS